MKKWKCNRCGLCCHYVIHRFGGSDEAIRYYKAHENFIVAYGKALKMNVVLIKSECKHLTKENECSIYDKRPLPCREHEEEGCLLMHDLIPSDK